MVARPKLDVSTKHIIRSIAPVYDLDIDIEFIYAGQKEPEADEVWFPELEPGTLVRLVNVQGQLDRDDNYRVGPIEFIDNGLKSSDYVDFAYYLKNEIEEFYG